MIEERKLNHTITYQDITNLNKILKGSGWTVGKICTEFSLLESDINIIRYEAVCSGSKESQVKKAQKRELEIMRERILACIKDE